MENKTNSQTKHPWFLHIVKKRVVQTEDCFNIIWRVEIVHLAVLGSHSDLRTDDVDALRYVVDR